MSRDFTLNKYEEFLVVAKQGGYTLTSFENFFKNNYEEKLLILRHDVDKKPLNSLKVARIQHKLGVIGTYYFRAVKSSFKEDIIQQIVGLGHEIGYHYEDLTICHGNYEAAISHFEKWLNRLRKYYPVKTICMHGSPMSKWDNRKLWERYRYQDYDVLAEPYFDVNFDDVFYITDTGRRWDGSAYSVRDKVNTNFDHSFHSTDQIIDAIQSGSMPRIVMQNIHPQRWTDNNVEWLKELYLQKIKNGIKRTFFVKK